VADQVAAGKIAPAICVFPNGGLSGYRDDVVPGTQVETMIIRELVPLIDATYRTKHDRTARVIGGFSMGGGGALRLALSYPHLFSAAAAWAGPITGGAEDGRVKPMFDVAVSTKPEDRVRLLLIVGYDDLTYPWHAPTIAALQANKYPFVLRTIADLGHDLGRYYALTGDEFVRFLTEGF
jgi:endo-1,4-beta-xylanase